MIGLVRPVGVPSISDTESSLADGSVNDGEAASTLGVEVEAAFGSLLLSGSMLSWSLGGVSVCMSPHSILNSSFNSLKSFVSSSLVSVEPENHKYH